MTLRTERGTLITTSLNPDMHLERLREERIINGRKLVRTSDYNVCELRTAVYSIRTQHMLGPEGGVDTCIRITVERNFMGRATIDISNWSGSGSGSGDSIEHAEDMVYLYQWAADIMELEEAALKELEALV